MQMDLFLPRLAILHICRPPLSIIFHELLDGRDLLPLPLYHPESPRAVEPAVSVNTWLADGDAHKGRRFGLGECERPLVESICAEPPPLLCPPMPKTW